PLVGGLFGEEGAGLLGGRQRPGEVEVDAAQELGVGGGGGEGAGAGFGLDGLVDAVVQRRCLGDGGGRGRQGREQDGPAEGGGRAVRHEGTSGCPAGRDGEQADGRGALGSATAARVSVSGMCGVSRKIGTTRPANRPRRSLTKWDRPPAWSR